MAVVDTTVLVAAFDQSHPSRAKAVEAMQNASVLHVPSVVVAELTLVLRRLAKSAGQDGNKFARESLRALLSKRGVEERQEYDALRARQLYDADAKLSYVDAVAIVAAWGLDADLISFDAHQMNVWKP